MKISLPILFLALLGTSVSFAGDKQQGNLVAPIADQTAIDGCSWSASSVRAGTGFIFLAEYDLSRVLMNIDGVDVELKLGSRKGHLKKLGSVANMTYRAKGIAVDATYRTTWLCPEDDTSESCEVTRFKATYEVFKGSRHQVVHATGDVGC
jgi:hypothetical protein